MIDDLPGSDRALRSLKDTFEVSELRSRTMRAVKSKDTTLEVSFRQALWSAGLRGYRKNVRTLPGKPDVVFGRSKLAIFVHGCFWHRCPKCARNEPKTNSKFWTAKLDQNVERDRRQECELQELGFKVLTFWECDLRKRIESAVEIVRSELDR